MTRVDPARIDDATQQPRMTTRRTVPGTIVIVVTLALLFLLAWRMVPHPVGAARTYGKYEGKATSTAKAAVSEARTIVLVANAASDGNAFGPYTTTVVADAEEGLSGLQGTFNSIQPPDARAVALGNELDALMSDAITHARNVRIAARQGELPRLADVASPLVADADKLEAFAEQHS
jgi:hypothetical protein